jgi:hypothetical protein
MVDIEDIDKEEILAVMDKLAEEAGDWRVHLPFEALLEIHKREHGFFLLLSGRSCTVECPLFFAIPERLNRRWRHHRRQQWIL